MIRPLHDWLLVELDKVVEPDAKSIILVGSGEERLRSGIVKRAGPGRLLSDWYTDAKAEARMPNDCEVGDRVYFFRENFETMQGKEIQRIISEVAPGMVMVRARDLLYAD